MYIRGSFTLFTDLKGATMETFRHEDNPAGYTPRPAVDNERRFAVFDRDGQVPGSGCHQGNLSYRRIGSCMPMPVGFPSGVLDALSQGTGGMSSARISCSSVFSGQHFRNDFPVNVIDLEYAGYLSTDLRGSGSHFASNCNYRHTLPPSCSISSDYR